MASGLTTSCLPSGLDWFRSPYEHSTVPALRPWSDVQSSLFYLPESTDDGASTWRRLQMERAKHWPSAQMPPSI